MHYTQILCCNGHIAPAVARRCALGVCEDVYERDGKGKGLARFRTDLRQEA